MKKIILLCLAICTWGCISYGQITCQQSDNIISKYIVDNLDNNHWLYFYNDTVSTKIQIITWWDTLNTENTFIYFIDEMPNANWTHPCRYVFIDKITGSIQVIPLSTPPSNQEFILKTEVKFPERPRANNFISPRSSISSRDVFNDRYAVILSGGGSPSSNYIRYWNDCSFLYKVLVYTYGYSPNNIYVIMSDGTDPGADRRISNTQYDSSPLDLDGDGTDDIQYAATKSDISKVFDLLAQKVGPFDDLLVFTTDHGNRSNKQSSLVLWNNVEMYPAEFAAEMNKINAQSICIVMEQCYGGGFIPALEKEGRVILTACKDNEVSFATSNGVYNEFVYHWTSAMQKLYPSGQTADADNDKDGIISMKEAFDYAKANDTKDETPQYSSMPNSLGHEISLLGACLTVAIVNQSIIKSESVESCDVKIQNTTVKNSAKLTVNALQQVTIEGTFEVANGSELEISVKPH